MELWGTAEVLAQSLRRELAEPLSLVTVAFPQCEQASWLGEVIPVFTQMLSSLLQRER